MKLQYRQQAAFIGALIGAILGVLVALLYLDYVSDREIDPAEEIRLGFADVARLATATFALVRQINDMAKTDRGKS